MTKNNFEAVAAKKIIMQIKREREGRGMRAREGKEDIAIVY